MHLRQIAVDRCFAVLIALWLAGTAAPAVAAWGPGKYMAQALAEMMVAARYVSDDSDMGLDSGICLLGAYLKPGASYAVTRELEAGVEYALIAGGDEDCQDVDLVILDSDGGKLAEDTETTRLAVTRFKAPRKTTAVIRMTLYAAKRDAFCSFCVLRSGGYDVPVENLTKAGDRFMGLAERTAELAQKDGLFARFLAEENQAAVFGTILTDRRGWSSITSLNLSDKPAILLAAGDTQVEDIDLQLLNSAGSVLDKDEERDATPVILYSPHRGAKYELRVINAASTDKPTFVIFGALQMRP